MSEAGWQAVDAFIGEKLLGDDPVLDLALAANAQAGLPAIDVSPAQGKMLHLLARGVGARRILEVGTLGGYSTIWLARALPQDGCLISLEIDPKHAEVARANLEWAGMADRAEVWVAPALDSLSAMQERGESAFDFIFIDADKQNNAAYVRAALSLSHPCTMIVVDNVVRGGRVLETDGADANVAGTRALFDMLAAEPRLSATALQTVGAKKWDGFVLAIVTH